MRALVSFLVGILSMAVVVGFGVLVAQNGRMEHVEFLGLGLDAEAGWLWAAAAVLGFALAVLMLIPGRLAGAWRGSRLNRQAGALEAQLAALQQQYVQLHGDHERLLAEHQQLLDQVAITTPPEVGGAAPHRAGSLYPPGRHPWTPGALIAEPEPAEPEPTGVARRWRDLRARFQADIQGLRARFQRQPTSAGAEHAVETSGAGESPSSVA